MNKFYFANNVEKIEAFEERCCVRIENISFKSHIFEYNRTTSITTFFEVYSTNDDNSIPGDLQFQIVFYDTDGKILAYSTTSWDDIKKDNFMGFAVIKSYGADVPCDLDNRIGKVRIYPTMELD